MELWTSKRIFKYLCKENKEKKYCPRVRKCHLKIFRLVNSSLMRHDYVGVKKIVALNAGFSYEDIEDEYYTEAAEITLKINSWVTVENITNLVKEILDYSFYEDFSIEYCTLIAREIWNGRRQQMKLPRELFMEDIMYTGKPISFKVIEVE